MKTLLAYALISIFSFSFIPANQSSKMNIPIKAKTKFFGSVQCERSAYYLDRDICFSFQLEEGPLLHINVNDPAWGLNDAKISSNDRHCAIYGRRLDFLNPGCLDSECHNIWQQYSDDSGRLITYTADYSTTTLYWYMSIVYYYTWTEIAKNKLPYFWVTGIGIPERKI